jgi:ATP-dependent helicase/nuclease subunit B
MSAGELEVSMLKVRTGQYHPTLENAFLEEIISLKKDAPLLPVAVIAPSRKILERLQELLALENGMALAGMDFLTFYSFALRIHLEGPGNFRPVVNDPMLLEEILLRRLRLMPQFGEKGVAGGLPKSLLETLRDLIESGASPEDLIAASDEGFLKSEPGRLDVFRLYRIYQDRLAQLGLVTGEELIKSASGLAPGSAVLKKYGRIIYYGFYDLTGIQADFFRSVTSGYDCTLFFPFRRKHPAFRFVGNFFESVISDISRDTSALAEPAPGTGAQPLLDRLFSEEPAKGVPVNFPVRFFDASGRRDEVWFIAKEILRLVEEEKYSYPDILVCARSLENYGPVIDELFSENRIPYSSTATETLTSLPLVKTIRQLLCLFANNFARAETTDVLRSPYFRTDRSRGAIPPSPNQWDTLSRQLGIKEGFSQWKTQLTPWTKKDFIPPEEDFRGRKAEPIPREQARMLLDILRDLEASFRELPAEGAYENYADALKKIIADHISLPADAAAGEAAALETVMRSLDELKVFGILGENAALEHFLEIADRKLDKLTVTLGAGNIRGVRVLDAMSARGIPCGVLFMAGLNENSFPRTIREDPFLRDSERRVIFSRLGAKLDEKLKGYEEERLLFYLLLNSARDRIYCSHQRADEDGRTQVPSMFLRELQHIISDSETDIFALPKSEPSLQRRMSEKLLSEELRYLTPKEISIRYSLQEDPSADAYLKLSGRDTSLLDGSRKAAARLRTWDALLPCDGMTGRLDEFLSELGRNGFSPTSLEIVGRCPFQYFMAKVLDLDELEEPGAAQSISRQELGKIYHDILHRIYSSVKFPFRGDLAEKAAEITADALKEYESSPVGLYPLVWEAAKLKITENAAAFIASDADSMRRREFVPGYFEKEISCVLDKGLGAPLDKILFHGISDRIDIKKKDGVIEYFVIDYKYKNRKTSGKLETAMLKGRNLQLPIYMKLAGRMLEEEYGAKARAVPAGAAFYYLARDRKTGEFETDGIAGNFWEEYGADFAGTLSGLIGLVYGGKFFINPDTHCDWCPFPAACRKNHQPSVRRMQNDKATKPLDEIKLKTATVRLGD